MANTHSHHKQLEKQLKDIKEALLQSADLPFSNLLSSDTLKEILEDEVSDYRDRVYSPSLLYAPASCKHFLKIIPAIKL